MNDPTRSSATAVVVERVTSPRGELVLRRRNGVVEIVSNGTFLMDSSDGRSERLLADLAVQGGARRVLVGGLGVGFTLARVLEAADVDAVTVVEIEPAVVAWNRGLLAALNGRALDDPRVNVVVGDLGLWLRDTDLTFDAICLDVDNGPDWTVTQSNAALYTVAGLELIKSRLAPGGRLAIWSAARSPAFVRRLAAVFTEAGESRLEEREVAMPRGEPDVVWLVRRGVGPAPAPQLRRAATP